MFMGLQVTVCHSVVVVAIELTVRILLRTSHGPGHLAVEDPVEETLDFCVFLHFYCFDVTFELFC